MAVRKIFVDGRGQQLEATVTEDGKLNISVGSGDLEDYTGGDVVLDRSDLDELIETLMAAKDQVFDDADLDEK